MPERLRLKPQDAGAIARAFDVGIAYEPLAYVGRGAMGLVWRLQPDRGRWAVKELLWGVNHAGLAAEIAFQAAARDAGAELPMSVIAPDGSIAIDVHRDADTAVPVRLYEWCDLVPLSDPPGPGVPERAAAILAQLHATAVQVQDEPDPWYTTAPSAADWEQRLARARAADVDVARIAELLPALRETSAIVERKAADATIMCHLDFTPANVFHDRAGRLVVIDWDNAGAASAVQELASALIDWSATRDGWLNEATANAMLPAYEAGRGRALLGDISVFTLFLAKQANYLATLLHTLSHQDGPRDEIDRASVELRDRARCFVTPARLERLLVVLDRSP